MWRVCAAERCSNDAAAHFKTASGPDPAFSGDSFGKNMHGAVSQHRLRVDVVTVTRRKTFITEHNFKQVIVTPQLDSAVNVTQIGSFKPQCFGRAHRFINLRGYNFRF